jgi:hypothetical protein
MTQALYVHMNNKTIKINKLIKKLKKKVHGKSLEKITESDYSFIKH